MMFCRVDATLGAGSQSRSYAQRYGVSSRRAYLLPHATDVGHFRKGSAISKFARNGRRIDMGLAGITFIYVGRLWSGKGLEHLVTAVSVLQEGTSKDVSLLLIGAGPEERTLRNQCEQSGIRRAVFTGFVQKDALPQYYALADVFVFPTLGDPYGLVVDEAMACGLPVVSTSAAGEIYDRVKDGENGFVVPPGDGAELAGAMRKFVDEPSLCKRMGLASARSMTPKTPRRWAETFEHLMIDIANTPAR
jgi:glycosyltransferase involved in cell wall biosynthesis